jgi:membrane protein required for beta-lactamase induction
MKKLVKMILVAIPALVVAAAVGTTTIGCGDDTTPTTAPDMAMKQPDMAKAADMAKGTTD